MGVNATAAANQNKLKRNAKWRANRRTTSDAFLEAEQKSRDRYNEFTKLSRMFVKAYPQEFAKWMREGRQVTRQPFGLPRHIPAPPAPTMAAPPVQLPDFRVGLFGARTICSTYGEQQNACLCRYARGTWNSSRLTISS
jgi:hypothetical protein